MSRTLGFFAILLFCAFSMDATPKHAFFSTTPHKHGPDCNLHPAVPLNISVSADSRGPVTEKDYYQLVQKFSEHFSPLVEEQGAVFDVVSDWQNERVRARAFRTMNKWAIEITGGLARHPDITGDGLALILCHELGHHMGGFPRYQRQRTGNWSSTEGQADYFATSKCTRSLWLNDDNRDIAEQIMRNESLPYSVLSSCYDKHGIQNEIFLCIRSNWAAVSVSRYFADIFSDRPPQFETPNRNRVHRTIESHPNVQCRLDTFHQGSLCPVSHLINLGNDAETGACTRSNQQAVGSRPLCWYRPTRL